MIVLIAELTYVRKSEYVRIKAFIINIILELSNKNSPESCPTIQPPARSRPGQEMSAPARPPKTTSYKDLISEPGAEKPGLRSASSSATMRTSTPAPGSGALEADFLKTMTSEARLRPGDHTKLALDNFEYFASGLQQTPVKEETRPRQSKVARSCDKTPAAPATYKLGHFISLRSLEAGPVCDQEVRPRSPSPPPPPASGPSSLRLEEDSLPPPPSCSTLRRLSTYRR